MQVLEGRFRRTRLQSTASPKVRPTARRMRDALFAAIGDRITGANFLDLCAGSGAVGIEALSRGAAHTTFIERSAKMCSFILGNLKSCGALSDEAVVVNADAVRFLKRITAPPRPWDIVFIDPPYEMCSPELLALVASRRDFFSRNAVIIIEQPAGHSLGLGTDGMIKTGELQVGASCCCTYALEGNG